MNQITGIVSAMLPKSPKVPYTYLAYRIYLLGNEFIKLTFSVHKVVPRGIMLRGAFPQIVQRQLSASEPNNWSITYEDNPSVLMHSSQGNSLTKVGSVCLKDSSSPVFNLSEISVDG